jgi:hypothetical protein
MTPLEAQTILYAYGLNIGGEPSETWTEQAVRALRTFQRGNIEGHDATGELDAATIAKLEHVRDFEIE